MGMSRGVHGAYIVHHFCVVKCNRAVCLWCIYYNGCIHCLVGVGLPDKRLKDRDEVKWVLQRWEEVQAETILHPTPSMSVGGSSAFVAYAEVSRTHRTLFHQVLFRSKLLW